MQEEQKESTGLDALAISDAPDDEFNSTPESDASPAGGAESNGQSSGSASAGSTPTSPAEVVGQVREQVGAGLGEAKQKTGEIIGQVQQQATSRLEQQKQHAASGLGSVAETLRQTGQSLRENDQGAITQYVAQYGDTAAETVERVSSYLNERDVNEVIRDIEGFARREPTIFLGGAFLLGLLGARFLKSSAPPAQPPALPAPASGPDANYSSGSSAYGSGYSASAGDVGAVGETDTTFYPIHRMRAEE